MCMDHWPSKFVQSSPETGIGPWMALPSNIITSTFRLRHGAGDPLADGQLAGTQNVYVGPLLAVLVAPCG